MKRNLQSPPPSPIKKRARVVSLSDDDDDGEDKVMQDLADQLIKEFNILRFGIRDLSAFDVDFHNQDSLFYCDMLAANSKDSYILHERYSEEEFPIYFENYTNLISKMSKIRQHLNFMKKKYPNLLFSFYLPDPK